MFVRARLEVEECSAEKGLLLGSVQSSKFSASICRNTRTPPAPGMVYIVWWDTKIQLFMTYSSERRREEHSSYHGDDLHGCAVSCCRECDSCLVLRYRLQRGVVSHAERIVLLCNQAIDLLQ